MYHPSLARAGVLVVLLCPVTLSAQAAAASGWRTSWSYEGAAAWGSLDPEYATCGSGRAQSPIDITKAMTAALPQLSFAYHPGPVRLINNGYTAVRVNYPPGNGNILTVGSVRYELTQFHFHHPSEEYLHGKPFPMAAHFMHVAKDGRVLGVAVPLIAGKANEAVRHLWDHMPQQPGSEHDIPGLETDPSGLLPRSLAYYTYVGSQTAPPCTEGVTWIILKTPVEVSPEQVAAFARLYPHDVRPLQPLNGRVVTASH